jgi:bla regulator protein blaR1
MKVLSSFWNAIAPALGDHLWQSTLVVLVAGSLTLLLRKNHARARYWLWLAASLKFLVPFSWLVALGSGLAWRSTSTATPSVYVTVEQITQPFSQAAVAGTAVHAAPAASLTHLVPVILMAIWCCGFLAVFCLWYVWWRRISAAAQQATPLGRGREVDALRRLEPAARGSRVEIRASRSTLEPGIFGIAKPILLWPEGITERLDDAQLEAVIAHELWHVRRRDNLAAVVHMVVEAVFWFHPLVWWLGARLVDERERACDEDVLQSGSGRQTYAESILKVCEFCVGSPLPCVSGVTGADLKKRMVHIMSEHVVRKLDFTRRLLLSTVAIAAIAAPVVFGLLHATPSRAQSQDEAVSNAVESAIIKPSELNTPTYAGTKNHMIRMMVGNGKFDARNVTLRALIQEAYGVQANQVIGGPDWLNTEAFDVQIRTGKSETTWPPSEQNMRDIHAALQKLLAEHAGLVLHTQTKTLSIYALEVGENGPKLQPAPASESDDMKGSGQVRMGTQKMLMKTGGNQVYGIGAVGISTDDLAQQLSRQLGTPVVNKTGLQGRYDFNLNWNDGKESSTENESSSGNASAPSIFTAVQEQLGLKLQPLKAPMQVFVIDRLEKPTEN